MHKPTSYFLFRRVRTHTTASPSLLSQIRGLLIDAEDENVGLSQDLLEETHEDLNSLEDLVKRWVIEGMSQLCSCPTACLSFAAVPRPPARVGYHVNRTATVVLSKCCSGLCVCVLCFHSAGEKLERSVESLPVVPITLEEVEERTVKWRVRGLGYPGTRTAIGVCVKR